MQTKVGQQVCYSNSSYLSSVHNTEGKFVCEKNLMTDQSKIKFSKKVIAKCLGAQISFLIPGL